MKRPFAGLAIALLLAGCASTVSSQKHVTTAIPTFTSAPQAPLGTPTTNVLHFLPAPYLDTTNPKQVRATQVPVNAPLATGSANQVTLSNWNFTWTENHDGPLLVNLTLIVDVEGTVVGATSVPPNTNGTYPFWFVSVSMGPPNAAINDDRGRGKAVQVWEPQQVPDGVQILNVPIVLPAGAYGPGWFVNISLACEATVIAPGATVDLLTNSTTYDSLAQFSGLHLPVDLPRVARIGT